MDKKEARAVLDEYLARYRPGGYAALLRLLDVQDTVDVAGPSGAAYHIEIQAVWDGKKGGDVRVIGAISGGGWSDFSPLTTDFIIRADGTFVGE